MQSHWTNDDKTPMQVVLVRDRRRWEDGGSHIAAIVLGFFLILGVARWICI